MNDTAKWTPRKEDEVRCIDPESNYTDCTGVILDVDETECYIYFHDMDYEWISTEFLTLEKRPITELDAMQAEVDRLKTMITKMYAVIIDCDLPNEIEDWYAETRAQGKEGGLTREQYQDWLGLRAEFELEATGKISGYELPENGDKS